MAPPVRLALLRNSLTRVADSSDQAQFDLRPSASFLIECVYGFGILHPYLSRQVLGDKATRERDR